MRMYVDDNLDHMAFPNWDGGATVIPGGGWLYSLPNKTPAGSPESVIPDPYAGAWASAPALAWKSGLWWTYMGNQNSYLCPVDILSKDYAKSVAAGGRNNKLSSYVMNGGVSGFAHQPGCKSTQIWSPSCYLLWEPDEYTLGPTGSEGAEEFNDGSNFPSAPPYGYEGIGRLHDKAGGNILAMDGHVDFMVTNTFNRLSNNYGSGPNRKGLLWWSPYDLDGGYNESGR
jgi:hypothetical protein